MQKEDKERVVAELTERLRNAETLFVADYRGLTMPQIDALRGRLLENGARLSVVKNTLTRRAAQAAGADALLALLEGPSAIAFIEADGDMVVERRYVTRQPLGIALPIERDCRPLAFQIGLGALDPAALLGKTHGLLGIVGAALIALDELFQRDLGFLATDLDLVLGLSLRAIVPLIIVVVDSRVTLDILVCFEIDVVFLVRGWSSLALTFGLR